MSALALSKPSRLETKAAVDAARAERLSPTPCTSACVVSSATVASMFASVSTARAATAALASFSSADSRWWCSSRTATASRCCCCTSTWSCSSAATCCRRCSSACISSVPILDSDRVGATRRDFTDSIICNSAKFLGSESTTPECGALHVGQTLPSLKSDSRQKQWPHGSICGTRADSSYCS